MTRGTKHSFLNADVAAGGERKFLFIYIDNDTIIMSEEICLNHIYNTIIIIYELNFAVLTKNSILQFWL